MPEDLEPTPLGDGPPEEGPPASGARNPSGIPSAPPRENAEGERPCPVCGRKMLLERRKGIRIDVCDDHGIWLDNGELEAITAGLRKRLCRTRGVAVKAAERRGIEKGRARGSLWSLLFD
ncbi:MAG: TFIIB-type zinc ribbon-containing protein [Planctomycetota bacterium]|jgi:hypothetical protein